MHDEIVNHLNLRTDLQHPHGPSTHPAPAG